MVRRSSTRRARPPFYVLVLAVVFAGITTAEPAYRAPVSIAVDSAGQILYVAEYAANAVAVIDTGDNAVIRRIALPEPPGGLALSPDGATLYVTNAAPAGGVRFVDAASGHVNGVVQIGHTPLAPVLSADGGRLYVCNRFTNDISVIDVASEKEMARIGVVREPVAATLGLEGRFLFVANLLPAGASDGPIVRASVSVIDTATNSVTATVPLPNGSTGVRGICASPEGANVYVAHILARYQMPTTQLERGWMNTNALSILDASTHTLLNTVLLDDVDAGAANPWAVACSADGAFVCVTHAGTHEISVIDRAALHARLEAEASRVSVTAVVSSAADVPNDLSFLSGLRRRIKLLGYGPRALALCGNRAYTAEYFSDSVSVVDLSAGGQVARVDLGGSDEVPMERTGERLFNDAALCFQQWQSCASCHPDARADGLNWDLLNDGIGNPKNTKSMLLAHVTPPAMSLGIRDTAETAVRAGIKHIQFAERPEADAAAIDAYLRSLKPIPSPWLENGRLSSRAERGKEVFQRAGCRNCHPEPLFTNLRQYDVGTSEGLDAIKMIDTPALVELWRTAPYLHDGRAATLLDVFKGHNAKNQHGETSALSAQEAGDLLEYVLSQ